LKHFIGNIHLGIAVSLMLLAAAGCDRSSSRGDRTATSVDSLRYLALGDSYTIGESVDEKERWPVLLAGLLRDRGFTIDAPRIIAKTGWTTDELREGIRKTDPDGKYDLVSLMIGVNNQYRGRDAEEYRIQFRTLLEQAVGFASGRADRVIVVSIPDWGVTPFAEGRDRGGIAREIDAFNAIAREESESRSVCYVDVTPLSRETRNDPALVAKDGLHPSGKMHAAWARLILPAAIAAVEED